VKILLRRVAGCSQSGITDERAEGLKVQICDAGIPVGGGLDMLESGVMGLDGRGIASGKPPKLPGRLGTLLSPFADKEYWWAGKQAASPTSTLGTFSPISTVNLEGKRCGALSSFIIINPSINTKAWVHPFQNSLLSLSVQGLSIKGPSNKKIVLCNGDRGGASSP
jgi:hypothetical protein